MAVPVPAGLGVQDAGYVLCLRALGVPDATTVGAAFVAAQARQGPLLDPARLPAPGRRAPARRGDARRDPAGGAPSLVLPAAEGPDVHDVARRPSSVAPGRSAASAGSLGSAAEPAATRPPLPRPRSGARTAPPGRRRPRGRRRARGAAPARRRSAASPRTRPRPPRGPGTGAARTIVISSGMARVQAGRDRDPRVRGPEGQVEVVLAREPLARGQAQRLAGHVAERLPDEPRVVERVLLGHAPIVAVPCLAARFVLHCRRAPRHPARPRRPDLRGAALAVRDDRRRSSSSTRRTSTDRRVTIGPADILANLPYHPSCGMWFDNHLLTDPKAMPPDRLQGPLRQGAERRAPRLRALRARPPGARAPRRRCVDGDRPPRLGAAHHGGRDRAVGLRPRRPDPRPAHRPRGPARVLRPAAARGARPAGRGGASRCPRCASGSPACASRTTPSARPPSPTRACDGQRGRHRLPPARRRSRSATASSSSRSFPRPPSRCASSGDPGREKVAVSTGRSIFNRASRANLGVLHVASTAAAATPAPGRACCPPPTADARIAEIVSTLERNG